MSKKNRDNNKVKLKVIVGDLAKIDLKPGDVLALRVLGEMPPEERLSLNTQLGKMFPANPVVILTGGADLMVVSKPFLVAEAKPHDAAAVPPGL